MVQYDWPVDTENYPVMRVVSPRNVEMCGIFGMSFAYYSLKERLPIILTKTIDYLARESSKIKSSHGASDEDIRGLIQYVTKLKNDLVTNKKYDLLTVDTPEARRWNGWISSAENQYYFTNIWVFSECYVYRRLMEGCELSKGLKNFDPFEEQKGQSFADSLEPMCVVADKLTAMLPPSDKDKRKADFVTLLKICLWANKCDLSLSMGEQVKLTSGGSNTSTKIMDPFEMVNVFKDKVLVDDSSKICDTVVAKAEAIAKAIEGNTNVKAKCSCHRLATLAGLPLCKRECSEEVKADENATEAAQEEAPPAPCPAKLTTPDTVMFDIVCDNAGYELYTDLCLAHFLVSQNIVKKVRFHVKRIPWFVSDVTPRDFKYVISSCAQANYSREIAQEPKSESEGTESDALTSVNSNNLNSLAETWSKFVEEGTFELMCDDFWTSPHVYKDMKKYDPNLYRKLQFAAAILFKGDLNYRKLLGERNCNPTTSFESALQGFLPAPLVALRTVKADLICGLPKGRWEQLNGIDEKWMEKGDYGMIQFCAKCEPLKVSDRPCDRYGDTCYGDQCAPADNA